MTGRFTLNRCAGAWARLGFFSRAPTRWSLAAILAPGQFWRWSLTLRQCAAASCY